MIQTSSFRVFALVVLAVLVLTSRTVSQPMTDASALRRLAGESRRRWDQHRDSTYYALLRSSDPAQVALNRDRDIQLMYIDSRGFPVYFTVTNLVAARTLSTDDVWPGGSAGYSLSGSGTDYLGIWDAGGVLTTHQEFGGRVDQIDSPASIHYHATHVAGTMIAAGVDTNAQGMAYQAGLDAYDWEYDEAEMANAAAEGMLVSNHSYGTIAGWRIGHPDTSLPLAWYWFGDTSISETEDWSFGFYDSSCAVWDSIAHNAPLYTIVRGAGNDRWDCGPTLEYPGHYVWNPDSAKWIWSVAVRDSDGGQYGYDCIPTGANAKNIITVGAVHDIPTGYNQPADVQMSPFSSWGPTDDGRIKPDIVGNGMDLYSADTAGTAAYRWMDGTSAATPNISGSLGLLVQHYQQTHGGRLPRSSTIKAVLIHTADEAGNYDGPDYEHGWGLMNTARAADVIADDVACRCVINEDRLSDGQVNRYGFWSTGTESLRVTLAWTDPPGIVLPPSLNPTTPSLVNDLDVRVISTGPIYYPYVLDPSNPDDPAGRGDNVKDNVELIKGSLPSGPCLVEVSHKGTLASDQYYSLVVTGGGGMRGALSGILGPGTQCVGGDISVSSGDTLRLVPGTTLFFCGPYSFKIYGTLLAEGTETDSIVFTADPATNPSRWKGLRFYAGSSASRLSHCVIEKGLATGTFPDNCGGGVYCDVASPVFTNCAIINNAATDSLAIGGGVFCINSSAEFTNCMIDTNEAFYAGGLYCGGGYPIFTDCMLRRNQALEGAGMLSGGCQGSFSGCTISNNLASVSGGGIQFSGSGSEAFTRCAIVDNISDGDGGGLYCENSVTPTLTNCSISGNSASGSGGGMYCMTQPSPTCSYCTMSGNSAGANGGGVYCGFFASPVLNSTIIAFSTGSGIHFSTMCTGSVVEYCDIFGNSGGDIVNPANGPPGIGQIVTTNANGDPCDTYSNILLDPCFIYPPTDDIHLTGCSPCLGAAKAGGPPEDIEGNTRPNPPGSLPDIGACEGDLATAGLSGALSGTLGPGPIIVCQISISSGDTLRLLPGTALYFGGPFPFDIHGTLLAEGTATDSVIFTADPATNPSRWKGLRFHSGSSGSRLSYCLIENGLRGGTFPNNCGGGIWCQQASPVFTSCTIINNAVTGSFALGGGVYCEGCSPEFTGCTIDTNEAFAGGGLYSIGASPIVTGCFLRCNQAADGAGVRCSDSHADFSDCIISDNIASISGGGISLSEMTLDTFARCTIVSNISDGDGGGVYCSGQVTPELTNCLISGNSASGNGGGMHCVTLASPSCLHCTISGNSVGNEGGGVYCEAFASPDLNSSIVAFSVGSGIYFSTACTTSVVEYCDIFGNSGGNIVNPAGGPPGIGQIVTTNAMGDPCDIYFNILLDPCFISPPADDMHLADTSPCQGAADPASACTTDIDLNLRPNPPGTLPDIGAYEHDFEAFASVPEQPDVLPLTYALSPNQPNPFSSFTEIRYALPKSSYVNLTVYSVRGRRLMTLIDREEEAGYKSYRWRPDTLPSGIYFYRLRAGDFTKTRKMVLLK